MSSNSISFESLRYTACCWCDGKFEAKKEVLRNVSGEFLGCELTGIVGPSGSGKTSLLNVLTGYTTKDVSGFVRINGDDDPRLIRKRSNYIMQDYTLHHFITVLEAMKFAANFKLHGVSEQRKNCKIASILDNLGLAERLNRYTGELSGGEQKRLSIALELVDDPAILFVDEPTTGLDSCSSTQCVKLLKSLAQEGRTIICTIHTPSALILEMFDQIYAVADGCCIFQGTSHNIVPFLADLDLVCPETFNPADFLLEIANNDYGLQNSRLTEKIENGYNDNYKSTIPEKFHHEAFEFSKENKSSFVYQLQQLIKRNCLVTTRDKTLTLMRLTIHLVMAIFIGIMYNGIGNEADSIFDNYKFLFLTIFLLMFTAFSSLQTTFPLELPIIQREHFNGWHTATAYYLAISITDIPIVIVTNFIYIVITYFMTGQPHEFYRFGAYCLIILLLSFAAQGLGLVAGSLMNVKFTLILGSFFICPFVLFSNFFVQSKDLNSAWHWIFETSFIKHALEGSMQAIFGFDREKLDCNVDFCPFRRPDKFLASMGITDTYSSVVLKLVTFVFIFRVISFAIISSRLK